MRTRKAVIRLWIGVLSFFAWVFLNAEALPRKYKKADPSLIKAVDIAFAGLIASTIGLLLHDGWRFKYGNQPYTKLAKRRV